MNHSFQIPRDSDFGYHPWEDLNSSFKRGRKEMQGDPVIDWVRLNIRREIHGIL